LQVGKIDRYALAPERNHLDGHIRPKPVDRQAADLVGDQ